MFISDEHNKYRGLCNRVKRSSCQDKENWLNNKCEEIENSAQELKSRKTYMLIKDVNKGQKPKQRGIELLMIKMAKFWKNLKRSKSVGPNIV